MAEKSDKLFKLRSIETKLRSLQQPVNLNDLATVCQELTVNGHLAIMTGAYTEKIIAGEKTIESRFSMFRIPPFEKVTDGDVLFLKQSSGPIRALVEVGQVQFFGPLTESEVFGVMKQYGDSLCLEQEFIEKKRTSQYVTLLHISQVLPIESISVIKSNQQSWIILSKVSVQQTAQVQLNLFNNSDCMTGLHTYHNSQQFNSRGYPICKYCGADIIDWARIHKRDLSDISYTFNQLKSDAFRYRWWTIEFDNCARNHALRKGQTKLRQSVVQRLKKSIGEVFETDKGAKRPYRDGYQTPFSGNSIYYAQHALGCCCRKCTEYWHGIPNGRDLNNKELEYFAELIMSYLKIRMPDLNDEGIIIPRRKLQEQVPND